MQVIRFPIDKIGKEDIFKLYPLGDIHSGTIHCEEDRVKKKVNEISKDPFAYWIGMGDYAEFIGTKDPRWDNQVVSKWVEYDNIGESQIRFILNLLEPIRNKCIGLLFGNHEDSIRRHNNFNAHKNLCDRLEVKNLGYSCFIHLTFRRTKSDRRMIVCCFTHGGGNAITKGGKLNKLIKFMNSFNADIYGIGHMHDIIPNEELYLDTNKNLKIIEKKRIGAVTGSWFRTYTQCDYASYGEKRTYSPTAIGCPVFCMKPFSGELWIDMKDKEVKA